MFSHTRLSNNRSVRPFYVWGCTCTTLSRSAFTHGSLNGPMFGLGLPPSFNGAHYQLGFSLPAMYAASTCQLCLTPCLGVILTGCLCHYFPLHQCDASARVCSRRVVSNTDHLDPFITGSHEHILIPLRADIDWPHWSTLYSSFSYPQVAGEGHHSYEKQQNSRMEDNFFKQHWLPHFRTTPLSCSLFRFRLR